MVVRQMLSLNDNDNMPFMYAVFTAHSHSEGFKYFFHVLTEWCVITSFAFLKQQTYTEWIQLAQVLIYCFLTRCRSEWAWSTAGHRLSPVVLACVRVLCMMCQCCRYTRQSACHALVCLRAIPPHRMSVYPVSVCFVACVIVPGTLCD